MIRARLAAVVAVLAAAPAMAGPVIGGEPAPCVTVDIAGTRAGTLDCAAARLEAATRAAQRPDRGLAVPAATSPATVVGLASQAATRQRMGNTYGIGVRPQRPALPAYNNPIGRKQ